MKKVIIITVLLVAAMILCACWSIAKLTDMSTITETSPSSSASASQTGLPNDTSKITTQQTSYVFGKASFSYIVPSVNVLESHTKLAVKATVLEGSKEILNNPDYYQYIPDGYFLTPVKIESILIDDGKHKIGDTIIVEEYYKTKQSPIDPDITIVYSFGIYVPLVAGEQYLLFLNEPSKAGDYQMVRGDMGKFLLNEKTRDLDSLKSLSNNALEIGDSNEGETDQYRKLITEVMAKYSLS
jgi:hypothetical protein